MTKMVKLCCWVPQKNAKALTAVAKKMRRTRPCQLAFLVDCVAAGLIELPEAIPTTEEGRAA